MKPPNPVRRLLRHGKPVGHRPRPPLPPTSRRRRRPPAGAGGLGGPGRGGRRHPRGRRLPPGLLPHRVLPIGFGIPLVLFGWLRSRRFLWVTAGAFVAITIFKFLLPTCTPRGRRPAVGRTGVGRDPGADDLLVSRRRPRADRRPRDGWCGGTPSWPRPTATWPSGRRRSPAPTRSCRARPRSWSGRARSCASPTTTWPPASRRSRRPAGPLPRR